MPPKGLLDSLREGLQVIDPDYRYVYVNAAVAAQGKTTRESLIGRRMTDCYPGIDQTPMFTVLRRCMEGRRAEEMENHFTFPDGSRGWFELRFEPVPEGVAILSMDITARKRAEERLARTARALSTHSRCNQALARADDAVELMREVCFLIVESGGYAGAALLRPPARDGEPMASLAQAGCATLPSWPEEITAGLVVECTTARRPVVRALDAGERDRHALGALMAQPVARRGAMAALVIAAREGDAFDAAEARLLEEVATDLAHGLATIGTRLALDDSNARLERQRARTRAIFDQLPIPAYVWRFEGGEVVLDDLNDAADLIGLGELRGALGVSADTIAEGIPGIVDDLRTCARTGEIVTRELECVLPGATDRRRWLLTYGRVPPERVVQHARDVTDQRRMEEQLTAAQRLDAVGRLAGGAAHDFNNLLSVILTYADFTDEALPEDSPIREDVAQIRAAAERAAALTRGLLAFSRRQVLEPRVTDLNVGLEAMRGMLQRILRENVELRLRLAPDLGRVLVDLSQMEQVVMNLAINAADAMPRGGILTLETANVELDEPYALQHAFMQPGRYVRLACTDTGEGMTPEVRSRIFEPFFTTKPKDRGTGLGLSIVYGVVKQSGGNVWVYSEPGRGATFKIYLPRVDAPADAPAAAAPRRSIAGGEVILLVEDEPAVRRAAERILRGAGYEVFSAPGGEVALREHANRDARIDLLVTDVVMPKMSGRELAAQMTRARPALRVLFTSGYTDDPIVHHGVLDAGTHFIAKPFSPGELTQKVRAVLDAERGNGPASAARDEPA